MDNLIAGLLIVIGLFTAVICFVVRLLSIAVHQITDTNKQLILLVAGQNEKPETLRALVASNKPPQKVIPGIASGKKDKPINTDYTLKIGV